MKIFKKSKGRKHFQSKNYAIIDKLRQASHINFACSKGFVPCNKKFGVGTRSRNIGKK